MINKEEKYRDELFELIKSDLITITDKEEILKLLKDVFSTDIDEIKSEEVIDKLINL